MKNKKWLLVGLVFTACATKTTLHEPSDPTLQEGKALYAANCVKCHALVNPDKYTATEWTTWMDKMAPKAKIDDATKAKIYSYVAAGSKK